jgi:hypothetical protein
MAKILQRPYHFIQDLLRTSVVDRLEASAFRIDEDPWRIYEHLRIDAYRTICISIVHATRRPPGYREAFIARCAVRTDRSKFGTHVSIRSFRAKNHADGGTSIINEVIRNARDFPPPITVDPPWLRLRISDHLLEKL